MGEIELLSWNYKDTPDSFTEIIKHDYQYFESMMKTKSIEKYVVLITCNRVEIYFQPGEQFIDGIEGSIHLAYPDSIRHLFMVASGLESMALGENDILRQIKSSFDIASKKGKLDKFLSYTMRKALSVGKDVRTHTDISHGKTSLSSISLEIIEKQYGLAGKKLCIIGTGKMATALLNYLAGSKAVVTVAGRTIEHARNLAIKYGAYYSDISNLTDLIKSNQIIIAATSSKNYIIKNSNYSSIKDNKIMIDLSNPPNIEQTDNRLIVFYDLDKIYNISKETREHRKLEIKRSEEIVENELSLYTSRINEMKSDDIISAFYKFANQIKKEELEELTRKADIKPEQLEIIDIMMNSFAKKLLAPYTDSIKNFIRNNEKYSYILKEYDTMLGNILEKEKKSEIKEK
jgi:glutamyl-tRNA reductase